jgi:hypothetical protein
MNIRLIIFSGIVTAIVGMVLGVAITEIAGQGYYIKSPSRYGTIGASIGLVVGASQEAVRQLKARAEAEQD